MTKHCMIVAGCCATLIFCVGSAVGQERAAGTDASQNVVALERVPPEVRTDRQRVALGQAYHQAGRLDEAFEQATVALKHAPDDADAWLIQGDVWRERGEWQRALNAFDHAAKAQPDRADIALRRGQALMELGRTREADLAFERYRALQQARSIAK